MRTARSLRPLGIIAVTALLAFAVIGAVAPIALAQSGGTLVIGLDQEPPTLDPHASPSAVTYQVIGSVTERPSRATMPFCTVGTSAASTGTKLPSGSNDTSGS